MRQPNVLVAIATGTVVLAGTAIRFLRRRKLNHDSHSSHVVSKRRRHPDIVAALDLCAPTIRADIWCRRNPSTDLDCTFCLETIRADRKYTLRVTPCRHVFHACCLEEWVFYAADACLDWRQYSLSDTGRIEAHVRQPTCPNCAQKLPVLPHKLVRQVMLVAIARALSLRDLRAAAEMYDAGLVFRDDSDQFVPRPLPHVAEDAIPSSQVQIVAVSGHADAPLRRVQSRSMVPVRNHALWRRRHLHRVADDILAPAIALPMFT